MSVVQFTKSGGAHCSDCDYEQKEDEWFTNGRCHACAKKAQDDWTAIYTSRQDAAQFKPQKLVNLLLTQVWQHQCQIIPDYMPNFPREYTKPTCVIRHHAGENDHQFLRYSKGPLQGFFWDMYGDDFGSPEAALIALSQCPPPRGAICVTTHGT